MNTARMIKGALRVGVVLVAVSTAPVVVTAEPPPPPATLAPGVGDILGVAVFARPDLTGSYPIGPDGAIRLPLVGRVEVAGEPMESVEKMLRQRISDLLDYQVPVTVDVQTWRPVYVIGDVTAPGEYAYTGDITVKMAFAKAGGRPSIRQMSRTAGPDVALVERDLWRAQVNLRSLLIRQAAVDAMLGDATELTLPKELQPFNRSAAVSEQVARQNALITEARDSMASSRELLQRQHAQIGEEISALVAEGESLQRQADLVDKELGNMRGLADRGLTTNSRMLDLRQMKETVAAGRHRQAANLSRARQEQLVLQSRLNEAWALWRRDRMAERFTLGREIEIARADLEGVKNHLMFLSGGAAIPAFEGGPAAIETVFVITRTGPNGPEEIAAEPHARLLPGDILEVKAAPPAAQTAGGPDLIRPDQGADGARAAVAVGTQRQSW
ncbi:MAG: polysaccharide biosynthesis/export family protein [Rhodospirillaceae bacterium]